MAHAVNWFEIPATDFERAKKFYESIFGAELQMGVDAGGRQTAMFPVDWQKGEVGGNIAAGEGCVPSTDGTIVFLNAGPDLAKVLARVEPADGKVIQPKTRLPMEGAGYIAFLVDSEGNRIGLHSYE